MQAQVETRPIRSAYQQHHRISTALSSANPRNPQNCPFSHPGRARLLPSLERFSPWLRTEL
jgi:hypothetical protein